MFVPPTHPGPDLRPGEWTETDDSAPALPEHEGHTLRNKIGDAHASAGRKPVKVAPRHAALAVNLAGSVALFLIETASAKSVA